jgi:hypothetical protein
LRAYSSEIQARTVTTMKALRYKGFWFFFGFFYCGTVLLSAECFNSFTLSSFGDTNDDRHNG